MAYSTTDGQDLDALTGAVVTILSAISPSIGKVEDEAGGLWAWERGLPRQAHWIVDVVSVGERGAGVGPQNFEEPVIRLYGYMPYSYGLPGNPRSTPTWRAHLKSIRDTLRSNPCLKVGGEATVRDSGPAQVVRNTLIEVGGSLEAAERGIASKGVRCHYAEIDLRIVRYLTYSTV